jgi:outer membrane protein assembly factor BamB
MNNASTNASERRPATVASQFWRHLWFPPLVTALIAAWWMWRRAYADYMTFYHVLAIALGGLAISFWFALYAGFAQRTRWTVTGLIWLAAATGWLLFKPVYNGDMGIAGWHLRFAPGVDARLESPAAQGRADDWQPTAHDYPRFLGNGYWPEVTGVRLEADWAAHPPQEIWRQEIGAGWSSFAIVGPYAVTQEQRGENELVTCYRVADGSLVWAHADPVRFDPAATGGLGGPGPRATPTVVGEKIVTQGATGIVNCLDARTGDVLWRHDTVEETGIDVPTWGKSGSPLVVDGLVLISVGAPPGEPTATEGIDAAKFNFSLIAFELETGDVRWNAGNRRASYASPIVATLDRERQIICVNERYLTAHRLRDGKVLWEHQWPNATDSTASATQPIPVDGGHLFISKGYSVGSSLLEVSRSKAGDWQINPLWQPAVLRVMKTKFNNPVVRDGYVYGLDDVLLQCIELETGRVMWKKRRTPPFGYGQLLLVGDAILILSEFGELALVEASPDGYRELASLQALDAGNITWNTPAFAPPYLLVRNAREAACYKLPLRSGPPPTRFNTVQVINP